MKNSPEERPFFIGWEATPAPPIRAFLKHRTLLILGLALGLAAGVTALQETISSGRFDFGNVQSFRGVLLKEPVPLLLADEAFDGQRVFYLVAPLKNGFPTEVANTHHLQQVTLEGTFIGDDLEAMIEVVEGSVTSSGPADNAAPEALSLGEVTLAGEIVDSKCHLGVMNPGRFKPHRACAIQCLAGGIPPILVAQTSAGKLAHYLLVGEDGSAINEAVLDYAAEPVEVSGTLKRMGQLKVLSIDPATIKRR